MVNKLDNLQLMLN